MADIDLKGRKILYELDRNARATNAEIAKKVRLSKESIGYRIERMKREGIIEYFHTIINVALLGYQNFRVYIRLQQVDAKKEKEIIDYLVRHRKIWWVATISGYWQLDFVIWAKSVYDFEKTWDEFLLDYRSHITDHQISVYTHLEHLTKAFLLEKERNLNERIRIIGGEGYSEIDKTDWKILRFLSTNARASLVEISSVVNSSPKVVAYRINAMERSGVIQGYRSVLSFSKLGYTYYKIDVDLTDKKIKKNMVEWARVHPNIIYIDNTIAGSDFECDIIVKGTEHFADITNDMKDRFGSYIKSFDYFIAFSELKLTYLPQE